MSEITPAPEPVQGLLQINASTVWPVCGSCGTFQQAVCTSCSHAGSDFRLVEPELQDGQSPCAQGRLNAESGVSAAGLRNRHTLFECPICEDIHTLRWYSHCHNCGEPFPDMPERNSARALPLIDELTPRVLGVFFGLVLITAAVLTLLANVR